MKNFFLTKWENCKCIYILKIIDPTNKIDTTKLCSRLVLLLMDFYCINVKSTIIMNTHNFDKDLPTTRLNKNSILSYTK